MVQRLAGVRDVRRRDGERDAVGLDLEEDRAGHVPRGVAACLERGPDAARRERRGVGLALDRFLPENSATVRAVADRGEERVVLLGGGARSSARTSGCSGWRRAPSPTPSPRARRRRRSPDRTARGPRSSGAASRKIGLARYCALGLLAEHVLAVDVGAGSLEVVLGLADAGGPAMSAMASSCGTCGSPALDAVAVVIVVRRPRGSGRAPSRVTWVRYSSHSARLASTKWDRTWSPRRLGDDRVASRARRSPRRACRAARGCPSPRSGPRPSRTGSPRPGRRAVRPRSTPSRPAAIIAAKAR